MRGIVWDEGRLHVTDTLELRPPCEGEVRVRVLRSGVCHSDLHMMRPGMIVGPVVLGHEAAGVVVETGTGVTGWAPGQPVMVSTQTPCGHCRECSRGEPANCDVTWGYVPHHPFTWRGHPVASFANVSSFASEIVVRASQLFATRGLAADQAALIGCAVSTGFCAARNLGRVRPGDRVAVIGVGGIGVNAIQSAALAGASVLAIDINPAKATAARRFGAQDFLCVGRETSGEALAEELSRAFAPIDLAIECSGAPSAVEAAIHGVKRGGRIVLVGLSAPGAEARLRLDSVLGGREIITVLNGGAQPARDYPELIRLAREGGLDIASQITRVWPAAEIEDAIAALRAGEVTRAVLDHTAD